jgi:ubiquitin-activating enzyme E1
MNNINENIYSRQLYVYGEKYQKKISETKIFISGIGGLGVEIAKNLILSGVKSVMLHDICDTTIYDLSSQYYLSYNDLKKNRAVMSRDKLSELNSNVEVYVSTIELVEDLIKNYDIVILTDSLLEEQLDINNICRNNNIYFISAITRGLIGKIFCDFGENYMIEDIDGKEINKCYINYITKEGLIVCSEYTKHNIINEGYIIIYDIIGIDNLKEYKVNVINKTTLKVIGENIEFIESFNEGFIMEIKKEQLINFKNMEESIKEPKFISNNDNLQMNKDIFNSMIALDNFFEKNGRLPEQWNKEDGDKLYNIAITLDENINEILVKNISYTSIGDICAIQSIIGSLVSQEVLKACTHKFIPINQWFCYNALDCLKINITEDLCKNISKKYERYSSQIFIFGEKFQEYISNYTHLICGSGTIGCELLKNFTMMGLGNIIITDDKKVKKTDLNRMISFNNEDINKYKSECAIKYFRKINKSINLKYLKHKIKKNTESTFNDNFYNKINSITNTIDNTEGKIYIKDICLMYNIPYIDLNSEGTKCDTQIIIPKITDIYKYRINDTKTIPLCILNNFPYKINHTIKYAKDFFNRVFVNGPKNVLNYLEDENYIYNIPHHEKGQLLIDIDDIINNKCITFEDCIRWSLKIFCKEHRDKILQLKHNFPKESKKKSGELFWKGIRQYPNEIIFKIDNQNHLKYIYYLSNIRADLYEINRCFDIYKIKEKIKTIKIPEFIPRNDVIIKTDMNEKDNYIKNIDNVIELPNIKKYKNKIKINPLILDINEINNYHIEFISYLSNARAVNYNINTERNFKIKKIVGNIVPSLITTTSLVAGLASIELYKLIQNHKKINKYRNNKINLSLPFIKYNIPDKPEITKYDNNKFTIWDNFEINKKMTLRNLLLLFKEKHKINLNMIVCNTLILYSFFSNKQKIKERMDMNIETIIKKISNNNKKKVYKLTISSNEYDSLPDIIYKI